VRQVSFVAVVAWPVIVLHTRTLLLEVTRSVTVAANQDMLGILPSSRLVVGVPYVLPTRSVLVVT
jgi:phosphatidylglycerophosphate synthase